LKWRVIDIFMLLDLNLASQLRSPFRNDIFRHYVILGPESDYRIYSIARHRLA
jgi:hypothetical protein